MKRIITITLTLLSLLIWTPNLLPRSSKLATVSPLRIGIISYWDLNSSAWDQVPAKSLILINPEDGILASNSSEPVADAAEWVQLVDRLKKKNVVVLGYVPTGYFDHISCKEKPMKNCQTEARIGRQVETYYKLIPSLAGIFFDETSSPQGETGDYEKEYAMLRSRNVTGRITVFNPGTPSKKAVQATLAGEHLVIFESSPASYDDEKDAILAMTHLAHENHIIVWHLLHSVAKKEDMCSYVAEIAKRKADYGYVTNIAGNDGDPTWNSLPPYWKQELAAFAAPDKPCVKK